MYKIYINDTPLQLADSKEASQLPVNEENMVARYIGKPKFLFNYIDMLEKTHRYQSITLHHENVEHLWEDFQSLYKRIEAAGGVVFNESEEMLVIFRRDSWDLPKGKIDPGESREEAAVREVQEETGIQQIELGDFLHTTYHTYKNGKGKRVLKVTYWFKMKTSDAKLVPQAEEDIEKAEWQSLDHFMAHSKPVYNNIMDVLKKL